MLPPLWNQADLIGEIDDPVLRHRFVSELRPMPMGVYEEPIRVPPEALEGTHGYLRFSESYRRSCERARQLGWRVREYGTRHFEPLNHPESVAENLMELSGEFGTDG